MRYTSSRALTDHQRRTAFAAASALVLGAAIAIGALSASARSPHRTTGSTRLAAGSPPRIADAPSTTTATPTPAPARHADPPSGDQPTARDERLIESSARLFLGAYLAYEVGPLGTTARRQLLASATTPLARWLIDHSVRLPPQDRPSLGVVRSLALEDNGSGPVTVDAAIEHAGWVSALILRFERAHGRWLVTQVT